MNLGRRSFLGVSAAVGVVGCVGADDRPRTENGSVPGLLHADVWAWCKRESWVEGDVPLQSR